MTRLRFTPAQAAVLVAAVMLLPLLARCAEAAEIRVIDGDTVVWDGTRVRLAGIDAPELGGKCAAERMLARQAKEFLERNFHAARQAGIEPVFKAEGRGRYGRTLGRITVSEVDLGEALIAAGLARPWRGKREAWCE